MSDGNDPKRSEYVALGALIAACLFWSGNFIAGRSVSGIIDPLELNLLRWIVSFFILLPLVTRGFIRHWALLRQNWLWLCALGLFGIAGFNGLAYKALTLISVVNALLITATYPVVAVSIGALINGYRPTILQMWGSLISMGGAAFLILVGPFSGGVDENFTEGIFWMVGGVISWLIYSLLLPKRPKELPQNVVLGASIVTGIVFMLPLLGLKGLGTVTFTIDSIIALFYISLFASVGGFLCWSQGVAGIGPERAGQFIHLMPLFGTILAILLLGERPEWVHFVGAGFIITGIILVNRKSI